MENKAKAKARGGLKHEEGSSASLSKFKSHGRLVGGALRTTTMVPIDTRNAHKRICFTPKFHDDIFTILRSKLKAET